MDVVASKPIDSCRQVPELSFLFNEIYPVIFRTDTKIPVNIADAADYFAGGGKLFGGCKKEIEHLELGVTDIDTTEECADPYIATVIAVYAIYGIVIQSVNVAVVSYDKTCLAF